jgi:tRNA 2-thiouridine synthesizing protein A
MRVHSNDRVPAIDIVDDPELDESESRPLVELRRLIGGDCVGCRCQYLSREAVYCIVLGFKNAPRCLVCLASKLDRVPSELAAQLVEHIHRRECFLKAWREAERLDSVSVVTSTEPKAIDVQIMDTIPPSNAEWDAGDMGCGELVMMLRIKLNDLSGGDVLKVRATDPAAPEDIPAWCRMTGHKLAAMHHPTYYIQRKGDESCRANSVSA